MAGFKTHITTSTVLGIGYGATGLAYGIPIESCLLAGGLCSVSGMLPDLDSDSGIPIRETMAFVAAVVPMLLIDRMHHMGLTPESMALAGGSIYILIRFGLAALIKKFTVHRGMFHSIPAALIFTGLAFLICGCNDIHLRYYKAAAVFAGFMSHLLLDELYSIEWHRGRLRLKKSFGTAVKFWGSSTWGNILTYLKLAFVAAAILGEPRIMNQLGSPMLEEVDHVAREKIKEVFTR